MGIEFLNGLTINLDKIPYYHGIENNIFYQQLDLDICELILETENPCISNEAKSKFKENIINNLDENDMLETELYQENGFGRFYYKDEITISSNIFYKVTCLKLLGWKLVDIEKSYLSILLGIFKNINIETPIIESIIENFDGFTSNFAKCNKKYKNIHYRYIKNIIYKSITFNRNKYYNEWKNNIKYSEGNCKSLWKIGRAHV